MSAHAASHRVLTITRMRFIAGAIGGQNHKLPLPSSDWEPCQLPGMPSCAARVSSMARTSKHGVIIGQYSPITQGWPYSWIPTRSSRADIPSITAVACSSGSSTARPFCSPCPGRAVRRRCSPRRRAVPLASPSLSVVPSAIWPDACALPPQRRRRSACSGCCGRAAGIEGATGAAAHPSSRRLPPCRTIVSLWLVRAAAAHGLTVRSCASTVTGCLNRQ